MQPQASQASAIVGALLAAPVEHLILCDELNGEANDAGETTISLNRNGLRFAVGHDTAGDGSKYFVEIGAEEQDQIRFYGPEGRQCYERLHDLLEQVSARDTQEALALVKVIELLDLVPVPKLPQVPRFSLIEFIENDVTVLGYEFKLPSGGRLITFLRGDSRHTRGFAEIIDRWGRKVTTFESECLTESLKSINEARLANIIKSWRSASERTMAVLLREYADNDLTIHPQHEEPPTRVIHRLGYSIHLIHYPNPGYLDPAYVAVLFDPVSKTAFYTLDESVAADLFELEVNC